MFVNETTIDHSPHYVNVVILSSYASLRICENKVKYKKKNELQVKIQNGNMMKIKIVTNSTNKLLRKVKERS